uniref:Uncharacterized protein n=1 Tax=Arundo donax TaxID=35708 RepID=A0A0A9HWI9_ARUDO
MTAAAQMVKVCSLYYVVVILAPSISTL